MTDKKAYIEKARARIDRWNAEIDKMRARVDEAGADAKIELQKQLDKARDATLPLPDRMLAALQVNIRGGRLPEPETDGASYLKIPLGKFDPR